MLAFLKFEKLAYAELKVRENSSNSWFKIIQIKGLKTSQVIISIGVLIFTF